MNKHTNIVRIYFVEYITVMTNTFCGTLVLSRWVCGVVQGLELVEGDVHVGNQGRCDRLHSHDEC